MTNKAGKTIDVAVIGGGPAGALAALVLARANRKVALIDRKRKVVRKVGESLPPAARPLLKHLDLLGLVDNGKHLPSYGNSSAWNSSRIEFTDFMRDPNGLGWHLDRVRFDEDLLNEAIEADVVCIPHATESVVQNDDEWLIQLEDGTTLSANWIIDASGRAATVARRNGAVRHRDDTLMAAFGWYQPGRGDVDTRTLVESVAQGWWYTSRLPDGSRIVVFHGDAGEISTFLKARELWISRLNETAHVKKLVKGASLLTDLNCTEASGARLDKFTGERWIATGDAALSFDPLSSQGLFNALYSGMKAGECVHACLSGDAIQSVEKYSARLEEIRRIYLERHQLFYAAERRWPDQPFWKKRTA